MKKILLSISMVLLLVLLSACNKQRTEDKTDTVPTTQPTVTQPAAVPTNGAQDNTAAQTLTVKDYYPFLADTEYIYAGEGNEFAFYNRVTDFIDTANNKIQTRTDNGGTETVRVIEVKDGKLSVIKTVNECYYRDNLMDAAPDAQEEVLLMEPLTQGTEWTLPDGRKRYISAVDVPIETPSGKYQTLEVTTESSDSTTKDYYAPNVGLVKSVFDSGNSTVSSTLSEIKSDTPFTQTISIYYPDSDNKIYAEPLELSFKTGDITRTVLEGALFRNAVKENYLPLSSSNTKINSMYLGKDSIAYVDFSPEFVTEMNAGAGYEQSILQCITNTLGNYYQTEKVYITVDGKPYESGHILMKKGETFKVDMSNVIR
jgi:hypothetical protein